MIINKIVCDRCGAEIKESRPDRLIIQTYHQSDRATKPSAYKPKKTIHLCGACMMQFEKFIARIDEYHE